MKHISTCYDLASSKVWTPAGFFDCKPLAFLWEKLPQFYNADNTVMIDDLRRNFIHNKQNGLVIKPFRHAHRTRGTDKELLYLKIYLLKIAPMGSFKTLRHSKWADCIKDELQEKTASN